MKAAVAPLLASLALVFATSACQREQEDVMSTPSDNASAMTPADPATTAAPPPMQQVDPCANLMGTELDECLRRQSEQATPPPSEQLPPTETLPPTEQAPLPTEGTPTDTPTVPPPG